MYKHFNTAYNISLFIFLLLKINNLIIIPVLSKQIISYYFNVHKQL